MSKSIVPVLILLLGVAGATSAAPPEVAGRVERAVSHGNLDDLRAVRALLLAQMESDETDGVRYDVAYVGWRIAQLLQEDSKKKAKKLLKESQRYLDTILKESEEDAEVWALRGSVIGDRITGMFSGMFLGPKAGGSLERAAELAPDNPRVALQRGIGWFFTPKAFGGGMENAEWELRRAKGLFDEEPPGKPWPNWGRVDALVWLGQVLVETGEYAEARLIYEEALEFTPGHAWITEVLMPALEKKETSDPSSQP